MPNLLKPSCTILLHIERIFLVATTLIRTCLNTLCTQEREQELEQEQQQIMENYVQYSHTVGGLLCGQRRKTNLPNEKTLPCKYRSLKDIMIKEQRQQIYLGMESNIFLTIISIPGSGKLIISMCS